MFKRLFGVAVVAAAVAACVKVVKDVLNADEEEKNVIDLDKCDCQQECDCQSECCQCHNDCEQ